MKMNQVVQMMKQWSNKLPMFLTSVPDQMSPAHMSYIRQLKKELNRNYFQIPLNELKVVVFDFETSGFYPHKGDQILSIGAVKVHGTTINESKFYSIVHTETSPTDQILALTGITLHELQQAPPIQDVLPQFLSFCEGSVLVAHHANHEKAFLQKATQDIWNIPFQQRIIDTSVFMKFFQSWTIPPTLEECCNAFHIKIRQRHHAFEDAYATAQLWVSYIKSFHELKFETLQDVYEELAKK